MKPASQSSLPKLTAESSIAGTADSVRIREARLREHADYQRVYHSTRKQFSASMTWFVAARQASPVSTVSTAPHSSIAIQGPRVGLTAGKVLGKAHERNRIKR